MKDKHIKRHKSMKAQRRLNVSKGHDPNVSKMIIKLHSEFNMSPPYLSNGVWVWVADDKLTDESLLNLLQDIENLKKESEDSSLTHEARLTIIDKLTEKVQSAKGLFEKRKDLARQSPFNHHAWSYLELQDKLNILLRKVKIEPGDALCDVNVLIEGSGVCSYGENVASPHKTEMYFVSLLQLLETCVLHERIWESEPLSFEILKEKEFAYGYFGNILQSEGILQSYSGIVGLTNAETIKRRMNLYKAYSKEEDERLIQDIAFSETARLKFIPHRYEATKFHDFMDSITEQVYQPLFDTVYGELDKNLSSQFSEIKNLVNTEEVFIPPISAIILNRASRFEDIAEVTLETRRKFSKTRSALMEYEDALKDTSTSLKKRLKILSDVKLMNQELAKPYDYLDSLYIDEWPDIWGFINDLFDGEFSMAKLAGKILGKPMAKAIKNIRLRNVAYLFNVRRKIYATNSHNNLVKKFLPNADIENVSRHINLYRNPRTNIQNDGEAG